MGKNSELLDRAVDYMVTFPVTILGLLYRPSTILSAEYEERRCPPGVALVLSLIVWFVGNRTILRIRASASDIELAIPLVPATDEISRIIVWTAALLLVQALVLSVSLKNKYSIGDWRTLAQYLAYPVATAFMVVGVMKIISVHFPGTILTLSQLIAKFECHFDSAHGDCVECVKLTTATFPIQLDQVTQFVAKIVYLWALYNVIRIRLGLGVFKGMGLTILALFLSGAVLFGGLWIASKTEERVVQRTEELVQAQGQRNSDSEGAEERKKDSTLD
jgi:hypothetical protein